MRTLVTLACTECKRRNYTTKKNKQNNRVPYGIIFSLIAKKAASRLLT